MKAAVYPQRDGVIDDVVDLDVMKFEVWTQLLNDGCLARSWRSSYQYSQWLHPASTLTCTRH